MIKFELEKTKQQALSDQSKVLTPITHHFKEDPELISHYPERESVRFQPPNLDEQSMHEPDESFIENKRDFNDD